MLRSIRCSRARRIVLRNLDSLLEPPATPEHKPLFWYINIIDRMESDIIRRICKVAPSPNVYSRSSRSGLQEIRWHSSRSLLDAYVPRAISVGIQHSRGFTQGPSYRCASLDIHAGEAPHMWWRSLQQEPLKSRSMVRFRASFLST